MRQDMPKVVVERGRTNATYSYRDHRSSRKKAEDDLPRNEGMRRPYGWEKKQLNETLAPLRRFLRSRVGQPWDKVYSEISENLKASNPVQQHVRDHLKDYVFFTVVVKNGRYEGPRRGDLGWTVRLRKGDLYVNEAGILCQLRHDGPKKGDSRYKSYVVSAITEKAGGSRHLHRTKTTYFLARKKDYAPASGEVVVETIEAVSFESARDLFNERYRKNPVVAESWVSSVNCRCTKCIQYQSESHQMRQAREREKLSAAG